MRIADPGDEKSKDDGKKYNRKHGAVIERLEDIGRYNLYQCLSQASLAFHESLNILTEIQVSTNTRLYDIHEEKSGDNGKSTGYQIIPNGF